MNIHMHKHETFMSSIAGLVLTGKRWSNTFILETTKLNNKITIIYRHYTHDSIEFQPENWRFTTKPGIHSTKIVTFRVYQTAEFSRWQFFISI